MKSNDALNFRKSRSFDCKRCGQHVETKEGELDRRTKFCSALCSRRYFRHPNKQR